MNCKKTQKLIPLYIGNDLAESDQIKVKEHLRGCLVCYREYQAHDDARNSLKELSEKPDLSSVMKGFSEEVMDRVAGDVKGPAAPVPRVIYTYLPKALAAAAMLLVVVTAGYYLIGDGEAPSSGSDNAAGSGNMAREINDDAERPMSPALSDSIPYDTHWVADSLHPDQGNQGGPLQDGETRKYPDLEPLPHKFPAVQPVEYKRNF